MTNDYSGHGAVVFSGIFAPQDAPEWARDREELWNRAEAAERQANGQPARNVEFALPHELTDQQREWLVKDFVRETFVRPGMVADVNIHRPHEEGDQRNHHAHALLTMREIGPDGFAKTKNREWNRTEALETWREKLAEMGARALERQGFTLEAERFRHGHETLDKQRAAALDRGDLEFAAALDRDPTKHLGPSATAIEREGKQSILGDENREIEALNAYRAELREEYDRISAEIIDLAEERAKREPAETAQRDEPAQIIAWGDAAAIEADAADEREPGHALEGSAAHAEAGGPAASAEAGLGDIGEDVAAGASKGAERLLNAAAKLIGGAIEGAAGLFESFLSPPSPAQQRAAKAEAARPRPEPPPKAAPDITRIEQAELNARRTALMQRFGKAVEGDDLAAEQAEEAEQARRRDQSR